MKYSNWILMLTATLLTVTAWATGAETVPARKPNVLFIVADDLKPLLGCYGDRVVKSPNIDRLAARGTVFTHAYCMQAVCAPSRNAVLTGLRPESLGIYDMRTNFRQAAPEVVTLPQFFKQQGWQVAGLGKIFHTGHGNHDDPASWSVPGVSPPGEYALPQRGVGGKKGRNWVTSAAVENADVPDTAYADGKIADLALERLRGFKQGGKPFFLAVGFLKPHLPFCAPKKYWDMYARKAFKLPARATLPEDTPAFAGHDSPELRAFTDIPDVGPVTADKARELIHGYHACVSYVDAQLGRVLAELDRLGLRDNTIILLWGDHGWHLGDHGLWCKQTDFEQATHAPLIVCAPRQANAGTKCGAVVEFVDIYPTLCDLAGLARPAWLQGYSLTPLLKNPAGTVGPDAAFQVYPRYAKGMGQLLGQAVRTVRWRLVEWQASDGRVAARELYDYQTDPNETVNLAAKPERAGTVAKLSALLKERLLSPKPVGLKMQSPYDRASFSLRPRLINKQDAAITGQKSP